MIKRRSLVDEGVLSTMQYAPSRAIDRCRLYKSCAVRLLGCMLRLAGSVIASTAKMYTESCVARFFLSAHTPDAVVPPAGTGPA
jgi:hypothetical protein